MSNVVLNSEGFGYFLRAVSILKDNCKDLDIRGGLIRQKNASGNCTFEIDLRNMINLDLPIVNIKDKLDLFTTFVNQDIEIEASSDDNGSAFSIFDQYSKLLFRAVDLNYIDNKFMSDDEFNDIWMFDDSELILSVDIPKIISDRMRVVSKVFNVVGTNVFFENNTATIKSQTTSTEQEAIFMKDIMTNEELSCYITIPIIPFIIDHDNDIRFQVFKRRNSSGQEIALNRFETTIGTSITIKVYCGSLIRPNE